MKISSKLQLTVLITIILIAVGLVVFTSQTASETTTSVSTHATSNIPAKCNCTNPNDCYPDGCSGKPKTLDNKLDSDRYDRVCKKLDFGWPPTLEVQNYFCSIRQPDSCFDIYKYKDDRYACFMERWFCHPSLCEGAGGNGDCGKYWHLPNGWTSYGCVKGPDNDHLTPIWGPLPPNLPGEQQPTNTPVVATNTPMPLVATNTPVPPQPTHTNVPNAPTNTPPPTNTPIPNMPTQQPVAQQPPTAQPIGINPQTTNVPQKPQQINLLPPFPNKQDIVRSLDVTTAKPLAVVNTSYNEVISVDKQIEALAESWIFRARIALLKLLNQN